MKHLNCCQKVLLSLKDINGLSDKEAEGIGSGFGGGAGMGELCGAAVGAIISLGMKFNDTDVNVREAVKKFNDIFKAEMGAHRCSDILGYDMGNPEEKKKCRESGKQSSTCPRIISDSSEIARRVIESFES